MSDPSLSPDDREGVRAALARESAAPRPVNLAAPGCLLFLLSLGLFMAVPRIAARWPGEVTSSIRFLAFVLIVLGILGGLAMFFFFGSGRGQLQARDRAEAALGELADRLPALSRAEQIGAAVRLLMNSYYSGGPWTLPTIDVESARDRLAEALPLVESIERMLLGERLVRPVFTSAGPLPPGPRRANR